MSTSFDNSDMPPEKKAKKEEPASICNVLYMKKIHTAKPATGEHAKQVTRRRGSLDTCYVREHTVANPRVPPRP